MKQKTSNNKSALVITTGLACNSACIMCSVRHQGASYHDATTEEIINDLIKGRKDNYETVDFSGGEPTVRKDIILLIKQARKFGYKQISISTNGMKIHDKGFCNNLIEAGLTNIIFSLHAHNKKLNEIITRTPNSFKQTVSGIKNALSYKNLMINVATAVFKPNYQYLFQIGKFIRSLGVHFWDIADLEPFGYAQKIYNVLYVKSAKLSEALGSLEPLLNDFQIITFFNFSPCVIPPNILNNKNIRRIPFSQKSETIKFVNHLEISSTKNFGEKITGFQQQKMDICNDCVYAKECAGIWTEYFKLFEDKEIRKLAIEHGYIKRKLSYETKTF